MIFGRKVIRRLRVGSQCWKINAAFRGDLLRETAGQRKTLTTHTPLIKEVWVVTPLIKGGGGSKNTIKQVVFDGPPP